jgi:hypothetical protein
MQETPQPPSEIMNGLKTPALATNTEAIAVPDTTGTANTSALIRQLLRLILGVSQGQG